MHLEKKVKEVTALAQLHDQVQLVARRVAVAFRVSALGFAVCVPRPSPRGLAFVV